MAAVVLAFLTGAVLAAVVTARRCSRRSERAAATNELPAASHPVPLAGELAAALDALPVGVIVTGGDGRERVRNRAARLDGVRHHQVLLDEALENLVKQTLDTGDESHRVVELHGHQPKVLSLSAHLLDAGGVIATVADITERVRLDTVRTDFVANLSHELKTPVGAMAVLAETVADLMAGERLDDDDRAMAARLATKMVAEAHRLSQSINELLELSRIEREGALLLADIPVASLVCEAVERARPLAEPVGIDVRVELPSEGTTVRCDARQVSSALGNLLENAVKYSEPGSGVEIGARRNDEAVEFWVRDHGVGIPARDLDRIFERFYRVDRARSRDTGGVGLGLAIVRHVVTNHGGTISVTSTEGEGSTFVLSIPCHTTMTPEENQ